MAAGGQHWKASGVLAALALIAGLPATGTTSRAAPPEDHSGLTRESFRRNCLMCHNRAAPEGISPEIMAGLLPEPGLKPFDAMPGLICWRRCQACKLPDPNRSPARSIAK